MNLLQREIEGITGKRTHLEEDGNLKKYLMLYIDKEGYTVELTCLKEIINYIDVTEVPNTSTCVAGVISLRGTIIPVINFSRLINSPEAVSSYKKNIIIIRYNGHLAGLPVDSVSEVIYVNVDKFSPVPQFVEKEKVEFFKGIIEYRDKFVMVLKTEAILSNLRNKD